jgi:hypothetical protein
MVVDELHQQQSCCLQMRQHSLGTPSSTIGIMAARAAAAAGHGSRQCRTAGWQQNAEQQQQQRLQQPRQLLLLAAANSLTTMLVTPMVVPQVHLVVGLGAATADAAMPWQRLAAAAVAAV